MNSDKKREMSARDQMKEAVHSVIHEGVVSEASFPSLSVHGDVQTIMQALDLVSDLLDGIGTAVEKWDKAPEVGGSVKSFVNAKHWFNEIYKAETLVSNVRNHAPIALLNKRL